MNSPDPHDDAATLKTPSGQHQSGVDQVQTLRSFAEVHCLLVRYPQLRSQLHRVYRATLEPTPGADHHSPRRHNFNRGRGRGRGRGNARAMGQSSWTPERGFKDGLRRLRWIREVGGLESEGIHEFSKLALQMSTVMASGRVGHLGTGGQAPAPASKPDEWCA